MRARLVTGSVGLLLLVGLLGAFPAPAGATFSGSNGKVAFASNRDGDYEIYAMDATGANVQQLTTNSSSDTEPNVAADGNRIVFVSDRTGTAELWMMNLDGTKQVRVTTNTLTESHPVWAPNATLIGFAGFNGSDSDIYTVKPDGKALIDLTKDPVAFDADPAWSPGGLTIAFDSTNRAGNTGTDVYSMGKDGTNVERLTTTGSDSHPNWAPDNKNITFESGRDNAGGPTPFASINKPIGVAVTTSQVLVTQFSTDKVMAANSSGQVTTFATLPTTGLNIERYIAVSPGLPGFPADDVYVTVGQNIYEITPDGNWTLLVNVPQLATGETSITFDTVGTFGNNMILTDRRGPVWSVDSNHVATQIGDVGAQIEGPVVAPLTFAPFGGQILFGNEFQDKVFALSNTGVVSTVTNLESPEAEVLVPDAPCEFGSSGGAYFVAMEDDNQILKFPAKDFEGFAGKFVVPSELDTTIAWMDSEGGSIVTGNFWGPIGNPDLEGSAFAPCPLGPRGTRTQGTATSAIRTADTSLAAGASVPREIYKMNQTGGGQTRLTNNSFDDGVPVWSPDNATIVFQTDRNDPSYPGCEATLSCVFELYSMNAVDGTNQTNITANAANDAQADWEAPGGIVTVSDFVFTPGSPKPKQGTAILWAFTGPSAHTATDATGMGLFDSGIKSVGQFFAYPFPGAGTYAYFCSIHPTMTASVKVPTLAAPKTGDLTTVFTITWAAVVPFGFQFDVQIKRPASTVFEDWKMDQRGKSATFTADGGTGTYSFQARLQKISDGTAADYSTPVSITVNP